tara:strand:+ start:898 stop:1359 length:462 start_codon:yes stop_codon:yes gene_type:complete
MTAAKFTSPTATRNLFPGARIYRPLLSRLDAIFNGKGSASAYAEATVQLMKMADELARATPAEGHVVVVYQGEEWILDSLDPDGPGSFWNGKGWRDLDLFPGKTRMGLCDAWHDAIAKARKVSEDDAAIDAAAGRALDVHMGWPLQKLAALTV